ncbi:MAG TPA: hypothetical protein PLT87_04640 [Spirochaetales bacterium]|nr:hypothetical protein [Spirochaetales bacterium]
MRLCDLPVKNADRVVLQWQVVLRLFLTPDRCGLYSFEAMFWLRDSKSNCQDVEPKPGCSDSSNGPKVTEPQQPDLKTT